MSMTTLPASIGRYRTELLLGQGCVARTILAVDPLVGRQVVVKAIRTDLTLEADERALLVDQVRQRVRTAASFSHPAAVVLHDIGEDENVGSFFVFEFVKGPTLREALHAGRLSRAEVGRLARVLGSALSEAHAAGVVHGNIKPDNVLLTASGPKLVDFGFGPPAQLRGISINPYCSPDLLVAGHVGPAADQFSLAATLYEALTARPAVSGDAEALAATIRSGKYPLPTSVQPELRVYPHIDTIFDRAFAKEARRRFLSCEAFGTALAGVLETPHMSTPAPISQASIVPKATRRWQNAAGGVSVVVILALVVLGRQPRVQGVSLKSVSMAFAAAIGPAHPARHARPNKGLESISPAEPSSAVGEAPPVPATDGD